MYNHCSREVAGILNSGVIDELNTKICMLIIIIIIIIIIMSLVTGLFFLVILLNQQ
jgi:hypothetical protein